MPEFSEATKKVYSIRNSRTKDTSYWVCVADKSIHPSYRGAVKESNQVVRFSSRDEAIQYMSERYPEIVLDTA